MWGKDIVGKIFAVVVGGCLTLFVIILGWFTFVLVDSAFLENSRGIGEVRGKEYHESYVTMQPAGKVIIPIHHPESWNILIKFEGGVDEVSVGRGVYEDVKVGQGVGIWYTRGRISNKLYINAAEMRK